MITNMTNIKQEICFSLPFHAVWILIKIGNNLSEKFYKERWWFGSRLIEKNDSQITDHNTNMPILKVNMETSNKTKTKTASEAMRRTLNSYFSKKQSFKLSLYRNDKQFHTNTSCAKFFRQRTLKAHEKANISIKITSGSHIIISSDMSLKIKFKKGTSFLQN